MEKCRKYVFEDPGPQGRPYSYTDSNPYEKEPSGGPEGKEIQIPIHSFLQILFNAAMAERTARYEVLGLSGDGTL